MTSGNTFVENLKGWQLWTEFKAFRFVAVFKQPLWKAFWVAVILGTFAAFIIQSVYILIDFFHVSSADVHPVVGCVRFQYNIDTVVQLKSVRGLPFPAVTICNLNPIRKSAMDYVEELSDLQTIYNYLSQKKAHESGTDASSGQSRKKRSAHEELSLFHELYDDVPIIAEGLVKARRRRQTGGSTCFLSPSGLTTSTMITSTTEAPTTLTTTTDLTTTTFLTTTTVEDTTTTIADTTTTVADTTTTDAPTTSTLHEQLHLHYGVVNDDQLGPRYEHHRHGVDHDLVCAHVDHDHRDQHDLLKCTSDEHDYGGELLDVQFDGHHFDARCNN
ncbi:hypothetical protein AAVH_19518 [Aphelenchoides avenae]|nr:hypothetical protein AAVH_19518 [Aphelenchus avenae]